MSPWDPSNVPPYPPVRYTKDEPEVSAWLKHGDEPPDYDTPGPLLRICADVTRWPRLHLD